VEGAEGENSAEVDGDGRKKQRKGRLRAMGRGQRERGVRGRKVATTHNIAVPNQQLRPAGVEQEILVVEPIARPLQRRAIHAPR